MSDARSGGVQRVLAKCQSCIDSGNFYEAHQMYRILYFRYASQKKYAEAIDLLYNGSVTLLQHNQYSSGTDLAMLLVEVLNSSKTQVTPDIINKLGNIFRLIDYELADRHQFLTGVIQWSAKVHSQHKRGHPDVHQQFGVLFWEEKNYAQARYHFLHSSDGKSCANMLIEYHVMRGYPSEADLFIAQAVLQYLCLQNKDTANTVFITYTKDHPNVEPGPPFILPLLNFIWFLLLAVEGGKVTIFSILCEKYEPSLNRDPSYKEYLDKIGQLFFGLPPPRSSSQGLLGNLIQSLLGGEDDEAPNNNVMSEPITPTMTQSVEEPVELD